MEVMRATTTTLVTGEHHNEGQTDMVDDAATFDVATVKDERKVFHPQIFHMNFLGRANHTQQGTHIHTYVYRHWCVHTLFQPLTQEYTRSAQKLVQQALMCLCRYTS